MVSTIDHPNIEISKDTFKRIVVGISGASGILYGFRLLQQLKSMPVETHLVISKASQQTRQHETDITAKEFLELADYSYSNQDFSASIASGSFQTLGMIIVPCSVKTLAEIANGTANSLLTRAADVTLKEQRKLVLMVRESPLHLGHLRNMVTATELGAIIVPPMPALYNHPQSIDDIIEHSIGRALDLFGFYPKFVKRWDKTTIISANTPQMSSDQMR